MLSDLFSLGGRLAVITGGSGAIGTAASVFLDLGASVLLTGPTEEHMQAAIVDRARSLGGADILDGGETVW